jgi:hypothetical protein
MVGEVDVEQSLSFGVDATDLPVSAGAKPNFRLGMPAPRHTTSKASHESAHGAKETREI